MDINEKDTIIMKLLHYFITEKGYSPVVVQGLKDEIWLENMKEEYEIVRINSNYIHNNEQLNFDQFKTGKISKSIRKKVLLSKMNIFSIYTNLGDNAKLTDTKYMTNIEINNENDFNKFDEYQNIFPNMKEKLKFGENGLELYIKITEDINKKNVSDTEKVKEVFDKKKPYITYGLILINIIMFVMPHLLGIYDDILDRYCLYGPLIRYGEYYRLLTSMFLHGSIIHLVFNMYALYIIGNQIENFMGKTKYLIIYIVSGIIGGLLSMALSDFASIGASGAIFGLMGSLLYFGYHYRLYLAETLRSQIIPLIILNLALGFMMNGIDNFAHIGGLVGGILITSAVGVKYKETKSEQINGIIITTIFLLFLIYLGFFMK